MQIGDYIQLYNRLVEHVDSLNSRLEVEMQISAKYREFFTKNPEYCNWLRDHNVQFKAFKNSPYYIQPELPTVDNKTILE